VGTHGRNAITRDGEHRCYEVTMDGHYAMDHILAEIRSGNPTLLYPTMGDDTEECDHGTNFGHIDYDRKIIYIGISDPRLIDEENDEYGEWNPDAIEYAEEVAAGVTQLVEGGWRFGWGTGKCPAEYHCVNSIPASIAEFLADTPNYRWAQFLNAWGPDRVGGSGFSIYDPENIGSYRRDRVEIEHPVRALLQMHPNGYGKCYVFFPKQEKEIVPAHYWIASQVIAGNLVGEEIHRIAREGDTAAFSALIQDWIDAGMPTDVPGQ
jgi:hypothetical protein